MAFGSHGKKRQRLGDGGTSYFKKAFSGQESEDDAGGSVTSKVPATQLHRPDFLTEVPTLGNESLSRLNSDASSISTVADCRNADALSRCTSLNPIEWPDAWEQPSVDTECANSEETWNWESSLSDLRSEVTVSGHDVLVSSPESNRICERKSRGGFTMANIRPFKTRGNRLDNDRIRKDRDGRVGLSGGELTLHVKDGSFGRDHAVDTSSELQELEETAQEEQLRSAFSANPPEGIFKKCSADVCMNELHKPSLSDEEDRLIEARVSPDRKGESLMNYAIGPSIEEDAFSGESKDNAGSTSYVHSSGRLSLEERARLGERSPTIDNDFEDYFSALLL